MSIVKSLFSSPKRVDTSDASKAAGIANKLQEKIYEETKVREQPFYDTGLAGTETLAQELGIQGDPESERYGQLLSTFEAGDLAEDEGYQFRKDAGEEAIARRMAAQGKTFSPEAAKAMGAYNQGMASDEYGKAFDRFNINQGNRYNRLANVAGLGQTASSGLTSAGQNYAGNVGQTHASLAGTKIAANQGYEGRKESRFNAIMGAAGSAAMASDRTLKENIVKVGEENGHNIYHFNYKGDEKRYEGVMAQEVLRANPEAVTVKDDKLAVFYDKLGLKMTEVN